MESLIPGVASAVSAEQLASDPAFVNAFVAKESRIVKKKVSSQAVSNSAVLQNDTDLLFDIEAAEVWIVHAYLFVTTESPYSNVPDIKIAWGVPAGAISAAHYVIGADLTTTNTVHSRRATAASSAAAALTAGVVAGNTNPIEACLILINGPNAGTVNFQWAQNTADPLDTIVASQSHIIGERIG